LAILQQTTFTGTALLKSNTHY